MQENIEDENLVQDAAEAIADGKPIDWDAQRAVSGGDAAARLDKLEIIGKVARAYQAEHSHDRGDAGISPGRTDPAATQPEKTKEPTARFDPETPVLFTWGPLSVLEQIGRGGFADVYRAWDMTLDREVALKLDRASLDERSQKRFVDEARKLARIRHEHVLKVHGVDVHEGRIGIWTDLLHGQTLAALLEDQGPYGADEASLIGIDLCCALASLHASGLIHRDITPRNVMREQGGQIVLMDFGSARDAAPTADPGSLTGTPLVTAPEVLLHGESPKATQDVYGMGVLLYYLVSRRYPIEARNQAELREKHTRGESVQLLDRRPDLPLAFAQVIQRALEPDPAKRFATAGEMQHGLASALGAASMRPHVKRHGFGSRKLWIAIAATVAAACGIAAMVVPRPAPQVQAALYREEAGSTQRLADGGKVHPFDQLFLEIQFDQPMYVWVVNEDESGKAYGLFPLEPHDAMKLPAGKLHRLPGSVQGTDSNWSLSEGGGRETFLVVAAPKRIPELETELATLPRPGFDEPVAADSRGAGTLVPRPSVDGKGVVARLMRQYADKQGRGGLWLWKVQLVNDGT